MSGIDEQETMGNVIELEDEEGNATQFEHLLTFEYGENFYVALLPVSEAEDMEDGEVLIMRLVEEEEEDLFLPVETEEELEGAWNAFLEIYYEEEGEDGCSCDGCCDCDHCSSDKE